jgi:hypothetical protein
MPGRINEASTGTDEISGAVDFGVQIDETLTGTDEVFALGSFNASD